MFSVFNWKWLMKRDKLPYVDSARLADVMAMIQVLALHTYGHRSDKGLTEEMQGPPRSASTWKEVALQHPEFFRVNDQERLGVSLVSRHVLPKNEDGKHELPSDFTAMLLKTAIDLHDRQLGRVQRWIMFVPIIGALIAGVFALICAFINLYAVARSS
jgi:hypothetical protein